MGASSGSGYNKYDKINWNLNMNPYCGATCLYYRSCKVVGNCGTFCVPLMSVIIWNFRRDSAKVAAMRYIISIVEGRDYLKMTSSTVAKLQMFVRFESYWKGKQREEASPSGNQCDIWRRYHSYFTYIFKFEMGSRLKENWVSLSQICICACRKWSMIVGFNGGEYLCILIGQCRRFG
jgi:hypothetical protein